MAISLQPASFTKAALNYKISCDSQPLEKIIRIVSIIAGAILDLLASPIKAAIAIGRAVFKFSSVDTNKKGSITDPSSGKEELNPNISIKDVADRAKTPEALRKYLEGHYSHASEPGFFRNLSRLLGRLLFLRANATGDEQVKNCKEKLKAAFDVVVAKNSLSSILQAYDNLPPPHDSEYCNLYENERKIDLMVKYLDELGLPPEMEKEIRKAEQRAKQY